MCPAFYETVIFGDKRGPFVDRSSFSFPGSSDTDFGCPSITYPLGDLIIDLIEGFLPRFSQSLNWTLHYLKPIYSPDCFKLFIQFNIFSTCSTNT